MWLEIAEGALLLGSFVYHRWFQDHPKPPPIQAESVPRTDEGAPIPLIYGRCRVKAPAVAWIGNWVHTGDPPVYFADILFIVGIPFFGGGSQLGNIFAGDVALNPTPHFIVGTQTLSEGLLFNIPALVPSSGASQFTVNLDHLFGGAGKGGGIRANIEFWPGSAVQATSDLIFDHDHDGLTYYEFRTIMEFWTRLDTDECPDPALLDATLLPGYRNQVTCFMELELGETPNFPSISFEVAAFQTGTASDFGNTLALDADPVAVIYDILTSPWGKIGLPDTKIDRTSFAAASATLLAENHGYSRAIEQSDDASNLIADILKQIDGVIFEEPTTGKLVIRLIRNDFDVATLDDLNPDNARPAGTGWYSVQGWTDTFNQVRVVYTNRQNNYADGSATAQNSANANSQSQRALRSVDVRFVGCNDALLARTLASRELAVVSQPMVKASVIVNRNFYQARPGDVFTLTWPQLGIDHMVMRCARVDLGQLHDGRIQLDLIRDVFDQTLGAFPPA